MGTRAGGVLEEPAGPEEADTEEELPAVDGRLSAASLRDWPWADLGCIIAMCLLDNCWRTLVAIIGSARDHKGHEPKNPIKRETNGERTALALCGIAELLETGTDLLGSPAFPRDLEDIVRDEFIPHWETAKGPGRSRLDGLVLLKT